MTPGSVSPPAQRLVEFFKKTEDSDLILAKEVKGKTILYSKKPDLLHSLRYFFSDDYANTVRGQQNLARRTINKFVDQGRHGDDLSETSVEQIKRILAASAGNIKAGALKGLFEKLDTQAPVRRQWEYSVNQAWNECHKKISSQPGAPIWRAPHIMEASSNLNADDLTVLKNLLIPKGKLNEQDLSTLNTELDADFKALKKFMKTKQVKELDGIDYQRIHALGVAWARTRPNIEKIDKTLSKDNPVFVTCSYLSELARLIPIEHVTAASAQNALPTTTQTDTPPPKADVEFTVADASLNAFLQSMGKR